MAARDIAMSSGSDFAVSNDSKRALALCIMHSAFNTERSLREFRNVLCDARSSAAHWLAQIKEVSQTGGYRVNVVSTDRPTGRG